MDLTMVGMGLLFSYAISSYFTEEDWDAKVRRRHKKYDIIATFICLLLVAGSKYHLLGG